MTPSKATWRTFSAKTLKVLALMCVLHTPAVWAQARGSLHFNYGPFDYRTDQKKLPVVEQRHFTPKIEA